MKKILAESGVSGDFSVSFGNSAAKLLCKARSTVKQAAGYVYLSSNRLFFRNKDNESGGTK